MTPRFFPEFTAALEAQGRRGELRHLGWHEGWAYVVDGEVIAQSPAQGVVLFGVREWWSREGYGWG